MSAKKIKASFPAVKNEKEGKLWLALKQHIIRERQRKKQDEEREVEEERLRKERETREKQNVMTLGQTRATINLLEFKLSELKNEKQQLFLQLKKVVNEDVKKRRKSTEIYHIQQGGQHPPDAVSTKYVAYDKNLQEQQQHSNMFLPPRNPTHQQMLQKINPQPGMKRTRTPSPPLINPYFHKAESPQNIYVPPKMEDVRRNDASRAVLWNKTAQYNSPSNPIFYPAYPAIRPNYGEMVPRPPVNKTMIEQGPYGAINISYKPTESSELIYSPIRPQQFLIPNHTNVQNIPNQQQQPSRIMRYARMP